MATIPRKLPNSSLAEWNESKPCMPVAVEHMERVIRSAPLGWQVAVRGRLAEPHHDATPHWHMLLWAENEAAAQAIEDRIRHYWLIEDGDERGAVENRINVKRMTKGGAAGYVAKYIAKSVGHMALAEHMDVVDGQQITLDFGGTDAKKKETGAGFRRVDAWAAHWGIRQFQTIGMPALASSWQLAATLMWPSTTTPRP